MSTIAIIIVIVIFPTSYWLYQTLTQEWFKITLIFGHGRFWKKCKDKFLRSRTFFKKHEGKFLSFLETLEIVVKSSTINVYVI